MKLKLTLRTSGATDDLLVSIDATATVGQLAERLRSSHPRGVGNVAPGPTLSLRVNPGTSLERAVLPHTPIGESGIRSGDVIVLTNAADPVSVQRAPVATLRVLSGADAGRSFDLAGGTSFVGRDRTCDVRLNDPMVSKRHVRINIADVVEVIDENSANGMQVAEEFVGRAFVRSTDVVGVGDTTFTVTMHATGGAAAEPSTQWIEFNRSPRLDPEFKGIELVAPDPPQRPQPQHFPLVMLLAPLLMGSVMLAAVPKAGLTSVVFIGMSPLLMVGSYFENKFATRKAMERATAEFRSSLVDLSVQLQYARDLERTRRCAEHPSVAEVHEGVSGLSPLTWTRRPEHSSFSKVRLGRGTVASRNVVKLPTSNSTTPELWRELHEVVGQHSSIDNVPVVADLDECGNVGVAGPASSSGPLAVGLVAQLVGLHSPAELVLGAICGPESSARWQWLKWLPHVGSDHSPVAVEHLAASRNAALGLIAAIEELLATRSAGDQASGGVPLPRLVVIVEDDAALDRARLVRLAESGPRLGVHLLWVAPSLERVPAACRVFLEVDPNSGQGRVGFVQGGLDVSPMTLEPLSQAAAETLGRRLAPVVDAGALLEDQTDLPRSVSFLGLAGHELAERPEEVVDLWRATHSLQPEPGARRLKRDNSLRALVGQSAGDHFYLDLRGNGPHALVGGTTGAGKSEFLQSWILGMATAHSPARVNFLFVDYKGGAAFAECVNLPHCVGLVTDLSPHLVRRALRSLNAELRRREHILNRKRAKDLLELERRRDPESPPSLVIVVDEFAALVQEVPQFVDGVVNVAQRGRSLGLHLILATQRPAGVIRDNLRANTNLRVALRMADEGDSDDVVGTKQAALFDPSVPGRAIAKTGPGRLTMFQSAYVGGRSTTEIVAPVIDVNEFRFGSGTSWDAPEPAVPEVERAEGPNDIQRIVRTVAQAARVAGLPEAMKPWLPELAMTYRLEQLPTRRTDDELVFGVIDRPDDQAQPVVAFSPDRDSNMAIFGTGGSGKSTTLRSIGVAAGFSTARGGPCEVYALDFGSRQLAMLEALPHVGSVIYADDVERTQRLLRMLRGLIDERAERFSTAKAGTIGEYRERSGNSGEARVLLLIDNFGAFRQMCEANAASRMFEMVEAIAAEGRGVGVHLVATADRPAAFSAGMNSVIQAKLALRLASDMDYSLLGVPSDIFTESSPPGRGYMDGSEVQVAVLGGEVNSANQAAEIGRLAKAMERANVPNAAPIRRLPEVIDQSSLPDAVDGLPALGVWDETLEPLGFEPSGVFVVTGPPQSGRTTAVAALTVSLRRHRPSMPLALFAGRRSTLPDLTRWDFIAEDVDGIAALANELSAKITSGDPSVAGVGIVVESIGALAGGPANDAMQTLVAAARAEGVLIIAEGESSTLNGWGLPQLVRADKYGLLLQPDQSDGDVMFNTSLPRVRRTDFPPGRGYYVRAGRIYRVQVPLPGGPSAADDGATNRDG